jgi:hypothetical protein
MFDRPIKDAKNYRLGIYSGGKGLDELFNDWVELTERLEHATPSHFPEWYRAFLRRPDVHGTIVHFIAIYDGAVLAAVFPVGVKRFRRFNLVELSIPLNIDLNSVPDVVIGAHESHAEIFNFFMRNLKTVRGFRWDVLVVGKTLSDSHIAKCIDSLNQFTTTRRHVGSCCYFDADGSQDDSLRFSKKVRANLRNARNRLESAGLFEFEIVTEPAAVMEAFSAFAEIEKTGWKAQERHGKSDYYAGSAIGLNPSKFGFYRDVIEAFADRGFVQIFKLTLDGRPIAVMIAAVLCGKCYLMRTAYDDKHARLSPGSLLLDFAILHHVQEPRTSSVVLFSDFGWLDAWKPLRHDYVSYNCFNRNFAGMTYGAAMRVRRALASRLVRGGR